MAAAKRARPGPSGGVALQQEMKEKYDNDQLNTVIGTCSHNEVFTIVCGQSQRGWKLIFDSGIDVCDRRRWRR